MKKIDGDSRFEELDEVIERFNAQIQTNGGIQGNILTIETVAYEANNDWKIDPQASLSSLSSKNILILRIFYLENNEQKSIIQMGIEDFAPKQLSKATFFKRPSFETFDKVIVRASNWLQNNCHSKQFINAQSIDIKMKSAHNSQWNTRLMAYTEHGDYIRIFRIAFLNTHFNSSLDRIVLSTRLFLPMTITDSTLDIQQRLSEWFAIYLGQFLPFFHHFSIQKSFFFHL